MKKSDFDHAVKKALCQFLGLSGMALAFCLLMVSPVRAEKMQPDTGMTQNDDKWTLYLRTVEDLDESPLEGAQYTLTVKTESGWEKVSGKTQMCVSKAGYDLGTLENGEYRLNVEQSPVSYMTIGKPVEFQVEENGVSLLHDPENAILTKSEGQYLLTVYFTLEYEFAIELPATGGMGTTPYTLGGILLIIAGIAAAFFCRNKKKTTLFVLAAAMLLVCTNPIPVMAASENRYYVLMKIAGERESSDYFVESEELAKALAAVTVDGQAFCTVSHEEGSSYWDITINDAADLYSDATANALAEVKDLAITSGALAGSSAQIGYGAFVLLEGEEEEYAVIENTAPRSLVTRDKNSTPLISFTDPADKNAEIGDTVTFVTQVSNHDKKINDFCAVFPKGLTPGAITSVVSDNSNITISDLTWTQETDSNGTVTCTLPLNIGTSGVTLTITYTAVVNEQAQIATALNQECYLTYSNTKTSTATCRVFTFGTTVAVKNSLDVALSDCEFTLQNAEGKYYQGEESNPRFVAEVKYMKTDAQGKITFAGLAAGVYTLTETKAADPYQKLDGPVSITINVDGSAAASGTGVAVTSNGIDICHVSTTPLPSTGGSGNVIFYGMGSLFILLSGSFLFLSKKRAGK